LFGVQADLPKSVAYGKTDRKKAEEKPKKILMNVAD